jgi:hypothetical protein
MIKYDNYTLIGIGDFSHGNNNIWKFRFNILKDMYKNTKNQIRIFNEDTSEHCKSIMNISKKLSYYKNYDVYQNKYGYGPLDKYCARVYDSPIYLEIIKFIRKHTERIKIIGIDPDKLSRDKQMSINILKHLKKTNINFFWGHNAHVADRHITEPYETQWNNEKYRCGYYLKKQLKEKYCIILSTGYKGSIRFDCECDDIFCSNRTPHKIPITKNILLKQKLKSGLYHDFKYKIGEFSACNFTKINIAENAYYYKNNADYVIFFENINKLQLFNKK